MTLKMLILDMLEMSFPERVVTLCKLKGWMQQQLADEVGVRVLQIRRYESGTAQPTQEEKKIAKAVLESLILKHDANRFSAMG